MNNRAITKVHAAILLLVILVATVSAAFVFYNNVAGPSTGPLTVVDMAGRNVQVPSNVSRVIIINSYWAEIACTLGDSNKIVGIGSDVKSSYYIPSSVKNLTVVGDLFNGINMETVVGLNPDLVIMDTGYGKAADVINSLQSLNISVITLLPGNYSAEMNAIQIIGKALGSQQRSNDLVSYMQSGISNITTTVSQIPASQKPTVLICNLNVWNQGLIYTYSNSTWGNAVEEVGGINVGLQDSPTLPYFKVGLEKLLAWNPDIIIITGRTNDTLTSQLSTLNTNGTWSQLKAVQNGQVYTVLVGSKEAGAYLDDGPRTMIGLMQLAKIIQPQQFQGLDIQKTADQLFAQFYQFNFAS